MEANPTPLFCCVVCLVRQQQQWSLWGKHFVLSLKLLKLTSSEGGDVMWNEWLLFFSNFTILAWNLISYPVPIKEPPTTPILFNKNDLIDVQKEVFFFSLRLCSGQWAHAMFIRLKVSHCNKRKGEKKKCKTQKGSLLYALAELSLLVFLLQIETKSLWKAPESGGWRGRFACDLKQQYVVQHLWSELCLCLTINVTPVSFMAGFNPGLHFSVMIEDRVDINKNIHMWNP